MHQRALERIAEINNALQPIGELIEAASAADTVTHDIEHIEDARASWNRIRAALTELRALLEQPSVGEPVRMTITTNAEGYKNAGFAGGRTFWDVVRAGFAPRPVRNKLACPVCDCDLEWGPLPSEPGATCAASCLRGQIPEAPAGECGWTGRVQRNSDATVRVVHSEPVLGPAYEPLMGWGLRVCHVDRRGDWRLVRPYTPHTERAPSHAWRCVGADGSVALWFLDRLLIDYNHDETRDLVCVRLRALGHPNPGDLSAEALRDTAREFFAPPGKTAYDEVVTPLPGKDGR